MALYKVRVGYIETNYVERDFVVQTNSLQEAREKALDADTVDEHEEITCEPIERSQIRIVKAPILK